LLNGIRGFLSAHNNEDNKKETSKKPKNSGDVVIMKEKLPNVKRLER
jgi:hypothetical protein